ncbi:MAG: ATP-dependent RecD-like DNA helicase [Eubacteriales bacterium]|nr:ATP-dependent RecD-like DNA helicase [Eubacteriales bacterium]
MRIKALVENIIYHNEQNHYSVLELSQGSDIFTAVGMLPYISIGETIEAEGEYRTHPTYGEQFSISSYQITKPEDADAIERYLAGGAIKGVGPALAARIVKKFGAETFRIMEEEPERLAEVRGVSEKMACAIAEQMEAKRGMRDAIMYMQGLGISGKLATRVYDRYGPALYAVLEKNPYQLAEDIDGVGFKLADSIAQKAGVPQDSDFRIKCGIEYALISGAAAGHTYLPRQLLLRMTAELLLITPDKIEPFLLDLQMEDKIRILGGGEEIYLSSYYYMEYNTALMLKALNIRGESDSAYVERRLKRIQEESGIELDEKQQNALREAVNKGVLIITGGPGTGKTTTINALIRYFEEEGRTISLAAPTGRAAKRMTEATGCEAKTIHRLLEYTGSPSEEETGRRPDDPRFLRNENEPLDADVIIIDEVSMVDIWLMNALLKAVMPGTRLILVGDANQLPSVGAGNVLRDLIASGCFETVMLTYIFRQAALSDIVVNAHRIHNGEKVDLCKQSRDFLFIREKEPRRITEDIIVLLEKKLPAYVEADASEIQVLTPTRKGALGVENLNRELQSVLNPSAPGCPEKNTGDFTFRQGDKVMQTKNNYEIEWERRNERGTAVERGSGIFNGDIGIVSEINSYTDILTVRFDDEKYVDYDHKHIQELEPAYAVTVHKSQGSEYPAVIIPMYPGPHMLMNRNLLYTAVTRARKCVCLVGMPQVFEEMEKNESENRRYSGLCGRIKEAYEV